MTCPSCGANDGTCDCAPRDPYQYGRSRGPAIEPADAGASAAGHAAGAGSAPPRLRPGLGAVHAISPAYSPPTVTTGAHATPDPYPPPPPTTGVDANPGAQANRGAHATPDPYPPPPSIVAAALARPMPPPPPSVVAAAHARPMPPPPPPPTTVVFTNESLGAYPPPSASPAFAPVAAVEYAMPPSSVNGPAGPVRGQGGQLGRHDNRVSGRVSLVDGDGPGPPGLVDGHDSSAASPAANDLLQFLRDFGAAAVPTEAAGAPVAFGRGSWLPGPSR